jgi:putative flavoprotein involved in K+ transport
VERLTAVVIGAGQAGLAVSHELRAQGVEHAVLERGRVGQTWRGRWDSFCLVTPNWTVQLPGGVYDGADPDGFMPRDEIVAHMERYAADAPLREGVDVEAVEPGFLLRTSEGELRADAVVVASGTYRRPHLPPAAATLPPGLLQVTADGYRSPGSLPEGAVLVVGSGQSGCQIAEELHEAGRDVVLSCGRAPWFPRRPGGRDLMWWFRETGFLDAPADSLPSPEARLFANVLGSGRDGGHDLNLRVLRDAGVTLAGRFLGAENGRARFADDLGASVAWGDQRYRDLVRLCEPVAREHGLDGVLAEPEPFDTAATESVELDRLGAVVFTSGFRPDYASWLPPAAFDELGFPLQHDGASTVVPGLYFLGVHFMRKRKSSLLIGVGEDAAIVARQIAA